MRKLRLILTICLCLPFAAMVLQQMSFCDVLWLGTNLHAQSTETPIEEEEQSIFSRLSIALFGKKDHPGQRLTIEERFGPALSLIHGDELLFYDSLLEQKGDIDWDAYQNIVDLKFESVDTVLAPNINVFGWHPYWMGSAYKNYNFDLLSHVSWFAYHIDPQTGGYTNEEVVQGWRSMVLQDQIKDQEAKTKVLLTVANHTYAGNRVFLDNEYGQQERLIDTLLVLLEEGLGDGIDINFELMPRNYEKAMTDFLKKLSNALKTKEKNYLLTVVLPKVNTPRVYDIKNLQDEVDYFLITGYDFHTGHSQSDGPIAPLRSRYSPYSIENTVFDYLEDGMDRKKLILGLPYYGAVWKSQTPNIRARDSTLSFVKHMTYRAIQAKYCITGVPSYDLESWSAYFVVPSPDSSYYEKVWFDDSTTLNRKYDWVLEQELGGIGIWALGYDNGDHRLWNLIGDKYAADTLLVYQDPYLDKRIFNLAETMLDYKHVMIIAGIFLFLFIAIGLIASLFDWRVREVFFSNKTLRLLYVIAGFSIILALLAFVSYINGVPVLSLDKVLSLGVGLFLGGVLTIFISRWYNGRRSQLP